VVVVVVMGEGCGFLAELVVYVCVLYVCVFSFL